MLRLNARIIYATLFYILLLTLVVISKPSMVFERNGSIKQFGIGNDKTMFSLGIFSAVIAIISFYTFTLIDIVFRKY